VLESKRRERPSLHLDLFGNVMAARLRHRGM